MAKDNEAGLLPTSAHMAGNEMVGIKDTGYIDKKGTASGEGAMFNKLPPGMDISDQSTADIRDLPMKFYSGGDSFPGDGWT